MKTPEFGSFFLAHPRTSPAKVEGEPWGEIERRLDLPGGPYLISGMSPSQTANFDESFSSSTSDSTLETTAHRTTLLSADPGIFRSFDIEGWEYTVDVESSADRLRIAGLDFFALVPWGESTEAGLWTSVEDRWFQGVIENYLRVLVSHRLIRENAVLLHSAGVVIDDLAYLFIGPSNAGKSTLAGKALLAGAPVLSDDLNAVLNVSGEPTVVQLPFTGEVQRQTTINSAVKLGGVFLIGKGDSVGIARLSRGVAVAALLSTAPFVNRGEVTFDALLDTANVLAQRVPIARMTCAVDTAFDEITSAMRGFQ